MEDAHPAGGTCWKLAFRGAKEAMHREVLYLRTPCKAILGVQERLSSGRSHAEGPLLGSWVF